MLNRSSDETAAMNTIKALQNNLVVAVADAQKWAVEINVEIKTTPHLCIVVNARNGGRAFVKFIPLSDAQYYSDDPNALVNDIADDVYSALLKDMLREELRNPLKKAIANCVKMGNI